MNSYEEVLAEVQKHDITTFEIFSLDHPAVNNAVMFLTSFNRPEMADTLKKFAKDNLIRLGPVKGFLAAVVPVDDQEYIVMSNAYPKHNTIDELTINLVHEIGATQKFQQSEDENELLEYAVTKWLKKQPSPEPAAVKTVELQTEPTKEPPEEKPETSTEPSSKPPVADSTEEDKPETSNEPKTEKAIKIKNPASMKPKTLIDAILYEGLITQEQLEDAKDKSMGAKKPLQELLVEMEFLSAEDLDKVCEGFFDTELHKIEDENPDPEVISLIPFEVAKKNGIFPIRKEDDKLIVAMSNLQDLIAMDDIRQYIDIPIQPILCSVNNITVNLDDKYEADDSMYNIINKEFAAEEEESDADDLEFSDVSTDDLLKDMEQEEGITEKKDDSVDVPPQYQALLKESSPTVKLFNLIIVDAIKARASDIHIEPREKIIEVRYRIDGDLKTILKIPIKFHIKMVARVKIMSSLDIAQTVTPQDGRMNLVYKKRKVDFRVSTIPTFYGEKIVARILDASEAKTDIDLIGLGDEDKRMFVDAIKAPQGMVFVTGPTGSGKTSTLYAALNFIKGETTNIITVEDPIEFVNEGINQIQINAARGVTFAGALRSILRQDPNVILIGEIRDKETAEIAVKASLTGHLLLSTLHTNDTISTITRLADIGLEYYQIASSVILIVSQRLLKLTCTDCKEEYTPEDKYLFKYHDLIEKYNIKTFYRGKGCDKCGFTGYIGRTAVFEVLRISEGLKERISEAAPASDLLKEAKRSGLVPIVEAGVKKVQEGLTTLEEVLRHLGEPGDNRTTSEDEMIEASQPAAAASTPASQSNPEQTEVSADAADAPPAEPVRDRPKILAVDDEYAILKIVTKYLELGGYDVINAENGKEAVEKAFKEKPDLIVMDLMMPVMTGFEATKALKAKLETAQIPIILLTAKHEKESEKQGLALGADDYMTKPFDKVKLLDRVKLLLKQKRDA